MLTQDSRRQAGAHPSPAEMLSSPNMSVSAPPGQALPTCRWSFLKEERKSVRSSPEHRTESGGAASLVSTRKMGPRGPSSPTGRGDAEWSPSQLLVSTCLASVTPPAFTFLSIHYHCFSVNNKHPRESQTEAGASSEVSAQGWALTQIPGVRMPGPREAGRERRAAPPSIPSRSWCGPAGPPCGPGLQSQGRPTLTLR